MDLMQLVEDNEEPDADMQETALPDATVSVPEIDDDDGPKVVSQQQLREILDVGPSFALPPIEEMFYQVADLFSSKPLAQSV